MSRPPDLAGGVRPPPPSEPTIRDASLKRAQRAVGRGAPQIGALPPWGRAVAYVVSFLVPCAVAFQCGQLIPMSAAEAHAPATVASASSADAHARAEVAPTDPREIHLPPVVFATAAAPPSLPAAPPSPSALSATVAVAEDGSTPERRAIDAFALGAYADAARIYDELARDVAGPNVFAEAAAAARRRAGREGRR